MESDECRRRFGAADHAYLATVRSDGAPHVVPVVFALSEDEVVLAVDHKPKTTHALQRLRNIAEHPQVSLLTDAYSADWEALWWVRADGTARVVGGGGDRAGAVRRLQGRYAQYRTRPPEGPVVLITVDRWIGWSAR